MYAQLFHAQLKMNITQLEKGNIMSWSNFLNILYNQCLYPLYVELSELKMVSSMQESMSKNENIELVKELSNSRSVIMNLTARMKKLEDELVSNLAFVVFRSVLFLRF